MIFNIDNTLIIEYNKIKQKRKAAERLEGGNYEIRRNDDEPDRRDHEKRWTISIAKGKRMQK